MANKAMSWWQQNNKKDVEIKTPSRFGSHESMIVSDLENDLVLLQDNDGYYVTTRKRLDTGLVDTFRSSGLKQRIVRLETSLLANGFKTLKDFLVSCEPEEEGGTTTDGS